MKRLAWVVAAMIGSSCGGAPTVQEVASPSGTTDAADPGLAVDPKTGDWLMTWVSGNDLWFARSRDQGATWTSPVKVTDKTGDVHPHGESSPRLAVSPRGVLAAVWTNSIEVPGRRWPASNIRFSRSLDGGATWSHALTLNDDTAAAPGGHIFHGAAWDGDSTLLVAWMDERGGATPGDSADEGSDAEPDARIYLATSANGGARWTPNKALWGAACPCCRVSLTRMPGGHVIAGWRKHFPGDVRDPVIGAVGESYANTELRVATDGWVYPGCPHTGPGIAVDSGGVVHATWYVGKPGAARVAYARINNNGVFGAPVAVVSARTLPTAHPRVAVLSGGGAIVASDIDAKGRSMLVVARISSSGSVAGLREFAGSDGADHPEMLSLADGTVLVAWAQRSGDASRVRLARVGP